MFEKQDFMIYKSFEVSRDECGVQDGVHHRISVADPDGQSVHNVHYQSIMLS